MSVFSLIRQLGESMTEIYREITEITSSGGSCVLVTVAESEGCGPMTVGKKMLVREDGTHTGTVGGGALEHEAIETALNSMENRQSRLVAYFLNEGETREGFKTIPMICGGTARLFYEYLSGGDRVYIFGGGHVGRALARQLDLVGFYSLLIEDRDDIFSEITEGKQRIHQDFYSYAKDAPIGEHSYVVICTPSHENDFDVVRALADRKIQPRYLGMLASPAKKADFLSRMKEEYGNDVDLSYIFSPVGLDIGGNSPAEIALSVAAEMLSIKYGKPAANHMRSL
jgi:xanthine dehydrogenase accessory factor